MDTCTTCELKHANPGDIKSCTAAWDRKIREGISNDHPVRATRPRNEVSLDALAEAAGHYA